MKLSIFSIFLLAGPLAVGQGNKNMTNQQLQQTIDDTGDFKLANMSRTFDNRSFTTRGTPLYASDWRAGIVTITANQSSYKGQFKLDVMDNRLMVKQPSGDSIWVSSDRLSTVTLNPSVTDQLTAHFRRFATVKSEDAALSTALVRVLHEGEYGALVQLPIRRLYKAAPGDPYSLHATTNEIRDESVYYLVRPDQTAVKVKLNRRSLTDAMGEEGKRLDLHAKANNLGLKSEKEVVDALAAVSVKTR